MRYNIKRYDDVFGTTDATMVCEDAYFNRSVNTITGSGMTSIEECKNVILDFIGSDDVFNLNNLHYIPVGDAAYFNTASEIAETFNLIPYNGITYDNNYHNITGIIKIEDKTTVFNDVGYASIQNIPDSGSGVYRGGSYYSGGLSFQYTPWWYQTDVGSWTLNPLRGAAEVAIDFAALPSDVINNGVISIPEGCKIAYIHVSISAYNIDSLSLLPEIYQYYVSINETDVPSDVYSLLNGEETSQQEDPNSDPYAGNSATGGSSGTGGGHFTPVPPATGTYEPGSDPNPVPGLPTISAADTGFITLFNPSPTQLKNLADYMWGALFDPSTWKKLFADPMDCILGLSIVPVDVPISSVEPVKVGNVSTGISMNKASSQFVEVNCGTISIGEKWKAYLDYAPYTKLSIYLPFIGSQDLNIDDIQINTIGVVYHIDVLSGACVAFITAGGNVIAQYSGQCAISIPVTSKDFTQTIIALGTLVAGGVAAAATGGMSAPVSAATIGGAATAMATTAANVITSKPTIQKSGNMSGSNGLMGVQTPYLFITRPKQCAPKNQNRYVGYPSYITEKLANLSGFTQLQDIRLTGINCTESEMNEILNLLHEGVIL